MQTAFIVSLLLCAALSVAAMDPEAATAQEAAPGPKPVSVLGAIGRGDGQCPLAGQRREALLREARTREADSETRTAPDATAPADSPAGD